MDKEVFLPSPPTAFTVQEVHHTQDLQIIGLVHDQIVLVSQVLAFTKCIPKFVFHGPLTSHEHGTFIVCPCSPNGLLCFLGQGPDA
jgi:hypothetical protein